MCRVSFSKCRYSACGNVDKRSGCVDGPRQHDSGSRGTLGPRRLGSGHYRDIRHFGNARDRGNPRVRVATKDCRGGCDRGKAVYLAAIPGGRGRCAVPCDSTLQERPTRVLPVPERRDLLGPDTTLRERLGVRKMVTPGHERWHSCQIDGAAGRDPDDWPCRATRHFGNARPTYRRSL
jgi:hypothetical protein